MPSVYAPDYRTRRIKDLLESQKKLDLQDMADIQFDRNSYFAPIFLKYLLPVIIEKDQEIQDMLSSWNHVLDQNGVEGSIYHETMDAFLKMIWEDDMGPELADEFTNTWYLSLNSLVRLLEDNQSPWFDKINTKGMETQDDLLLEAFSLAQTRLEKQNASDDVQSWKWGDLHTVAFHHPFEAKGGLIEKFFNYGPFPFGGDGETVNRGAYDFIQPYMGTMTASMRFLIDLADVSHSRIANSSGQVGLPLQDHYTELVDKWLAGEYVDLHLDQSAMGDIQEFRLLPSP